MWMEQDPNSYSSVAVLSRFQISEAMNTEDTYTTLLNHNCTKYYSAASLKTFTGKYELLYSKY